ncbi:MAG: cytochrome c [Gammaproteobacteria bacterium]|nr:cytochrome c [Gammaproteobacteria bacterium]
MRGLMVGLIVLTASCTQAPPPSIDYTNSDVVAIGKQVYTRACASCHGVTLEGQPNWRQRDQMGYLPAPPQDKTGHTWHHHDELLFEIVKRGVLPDDPDYRSRMPAYEGILSDEEIWAVLAYIKSTWPEDVLEVHQEINDNAKAMMEH